jgi:hypothetical protein
MFCSPHFSFFLCDKHIVVISKVHYKSTIFLRFIQKHYGHNVFSFHYGHFCGLLPPMSHHGHIMFFLHDLHAQFPPIGTQSRIASIKMVILPLRSCNSPFSTFTTFWNIFVQRGFTHKFPFFSTWGYFPLGRWPLMLEFWSGVFHLKFPLLTQRIKNYIVLTWFANEFHI